MNLHEKLIEACKQSDREAQYKIYKLYAKAMYNTSYRILKSREEAEDVVQEAFITVFERLATFRHESSFGTWLKQIVVNKSINALKKKKTTRLIDEPVEPPADQDFYTGSEAEQYLLHLVYKAFHQLPDGYRLIFSLYMLEGYDHEEIAGILNISESTSRSQLLRAKKKIREYVHAKRDYKKEIPVYN